jgi:DNA-binding response OmpR family regulator
MVANKTLLVLTEEKILQDIFRGQLRNIKGFEKTLVISNISESINALSTSDIDFIIIDTNLLKNNDISLLQTIRDWSPMVPIIAIGSKKFNKTKLLNIKPGPDDYIEKPIYIEDLLVSINNLSDIRKESLSKSFVIGDFDFRPSFKNLLNKETREIIKLTDKETAILKYLIKFRGKKVNKSELLQAVWGYNSKIKTHTLETHVYRLRRKINNSDSIFQHLKTIEGGYQLKK